MVMDQDTAKQLADLRYQLDELRAALGVATPDQAENQVGRLVSTVGMLSRKVTALETWAESMTPPYVPPA